MGGEDCRALADPLQMLKAISIRQPYAFLVAHGFKDIENRVWPTDFRGRVLIHASSNFASMSYEERRRLEHLVGYHPRIWHRLLEDKRSGIVGEVDITDCVTKHNSIWFSGPYGFVLKNARPTDLKPCKGHTFFFTPRFD